ncbi:MAG: hypothetical protein ACFCAD_26715 [Pleurocapsa sp.]
MIITELIGSAFDIEDLFKLRLIDLKRICSKLKIRGYSKLNKTELRELVIRETECMRDGLFNYTKPTLDEIYSLVEELTTDFNLFSENFKYEDSFEQIFEKNSKYIGVPVDEVCPMYYWSILHEIGHMYLDFMNFRVYIDHNKVTEEEHLEAHKYSHLLHEEDVCNWCSLVSDIKKWLPPAYDVELLYILENLPRRNWGTPLYAKALIQHNTVYKITNELKQIGITEDNYLRTDDSVLIAFLEKNGKISSI